MVFFFAKAAENQPGRWVVTMIELTLGEIVKRVESSQGENPADATQEAAHQIMEAGW